MIKPIGKNVLIRPITEMTNLGNGLKINNETQNRKDIITGLVIGGNYTGDKIYFPLYASNPITYNGENLLLLNEDDILAVEASDDTENN